MTRLMTILAVALMALSAQVAAETRIGVVDLRQALFSSNDAQAFSEKLQQDFAGSTLCIYSSSAATANK